MIHDALPLRIVPISRTPKVQNKTQEQYTEFSRAGFSRPGECFLTLETIDTPIRSQVAISELNNIYFTDL